MNEKINIYELINDSLELEPEEYTKKYGEPKFGVHGKLIDVKQMAYYDLRIYEDGYEEIYPIGD